MTHHPEYGESATVRHWHQAISRREVVVGYVVIQVPLIILKTAVGREKAVQSIDVHRKWKNCVVTFWVMSQFFHFLGASRGCADFRDLTYRF